jgi:hypothetical protein
MHIRSAAPWILALILIGALSFGLGFLDGRRAGFSAVGVNVDSVQAMLAFNRLLDERHWGSLLANGCVSQAKKALDVAQDQDTELLSELVQRKVDQRTLKYIGDRDSSLLAQLKYFRSKYGSSWDEAPCAGAK